MSSSFKVKNIERDSTIEDVKYKAADGGIYFPIPSDLRIKENIKVVSDLNSSCDLIKKLKVKTFHYKQDSRFPKGERIGLIAQEVEKVIPSAVTKARIRRTNDDVSNIKMIEMDQLVMHLLATVQSLTKRIEELEKK